VAVEAVEEAHKIYSNLARLASKQCDFGCGILRFQGADFEIVDFQLKIFDLTRFHDFSTNQSIENRKFSFISPLCFRPGYFRDMSKRWMVTKYPHRPGPLKPRRLVS